MAEQHSTLGISTESGTMVGGAQPEGIATGLRDGARSILLPVTLAISVLFLWELLVRLNNIPQVILPAPSVILKTLQDEAGLDDNNIKMKVAECTYQVRQTEFKKAAISFARQLTFRTIFYGEAKQEIIKHLHTISHEIKATISMLESA